MKKTTPKKRVLKAKDEFVDIRELLSQGGSGNAVLDIAPLEEKDAPKELRGRVWTLRFAHEGKKYRAMHCIAQTAGWKPKAGDRVRIERQPKGVTDAYLFAYLLP